MEDRYDTDIDDLWRLVIEERGMPLDQLAAYGAGGQFTSKISPPTSTVVSVATCRNGGPSPSPAIKRWPRASASRIKLWEIETT